jgi:hypothetical protein
LRLVELEAWLASTQGGLTAGLVEQLLEQCAEQKLRQPGGAGLSLHQPRCCTAGAIMPALLFRRAASIRQGDSALVRVLQATIETLRAEIEMLERRLVAAEARAEGAIVELSALTERLTPRAPDPARRWWRRMRMRSLLVALLLAGTASTAVRACRAETIHGALAKAYGTHDPDRAHLAQHRRPARAARERERRHPAARHD